MLRLASLLACLLTAVSTPAQEPTEAGIELFEKKIRPLLATHCYACHGADKQRSRLRLDSPAAIRRGGSRGPAVVPGKPDGSLLVQAVRYTHPKLKMPPRRRLTEDAIATLVDWVQRGAPAPEGPDAGAAGVEEFDLEARKKHWCFQPVRRTRPPRSTSSDWATTPIDRFILARLEKRGLPPARAASRRTLIRRAYFDLHGLPPPPERVVAFVADESATAWRDVIDRLLDAPQFGERWARHWLDLVRYAESRGHEYDYIQPNVWQYRDYVIRALNADVPYDTFVREHIAGDLLDEPRLHPERRFNESVLGTGFWFLGEEVHSPVDPRAEECDRIDNKIDVLAKTFLGLTLGCARCHDHKFDAISTRDYYAMSGFVMSTSYRQVRFESMEHNARVAARLEALRTEHEPRIAVGLAAALAERAAGVEGYLAGAHDAMTSGGGEPEPGSVIPRGVALLFEAFEGTDYGGWLREGTAFGARPMAREHMPSYQGEVGQRGKGLVNTHDARGGAKKPDGHTGRLISPPFEIELPYIQFLIGGGNHARKTCLDLVVDGRVVRSAVGRNDNRMRRAWFDVRDLIGRRARLRIVDDVEGAWGNIGVDHIVFAASMSQGAFDSALSRDELRSLAGTVRRSARERGLDPRRLWRVVSGIRSAEPGSWLRPWRDLVAGRRATPNADQPAHAAAVVADYGGGTASWIQDGFTFGTGPRRPGDLRLSPDGHRVTGIVVRAAAEQDAAWDRLRIAPRTQKSPTQVNWVQSGRLLRTPTVAIERKKLWYLVRGAGHALAVIDGHRLIDGPLHRRNIKGFGPSATYRWVEHDVSDYVGRRVHVELSPRGDSDSPLAVARVVQSDTRPPLATRDAVPSAGRDAETLARAFGTAIRSALRALATGEVTPAQARVLDEVVRGETLLGPGAQDNAVLHRLVTRYAAARAELLAEVRVESHTAPALLDGTGVNSPVLIRGDVRSPGEVVPRAFLSALDPAACGTPDRSGRLELADKFADPANPLTARVIVNRVWHHLLGTGLVASVDNFGKLGEMPSHPELLDWLAHRFVAEGWSIKKLIREIMLTKTYRMSSRTSQRGAAVDPQNRLLWRAPVKRLQAEIIRDAMLAVSGRLDPTMHGPSVPLHRSQFFNSVERGLANGPIDGNGRRSIYLAVRRNCLSKFFLAFDYPLPAGTRGRRSVTNVPAQALALLNNPFVVDQAGRWAARLVEKGPKSAAARVRTMYHEAFARPPAPEELESALAFVRAQQREHEGPKAEEKAWTDLCHVLFNVKEFIFIR